MGIYVPWLVDAARMAVAGTGRQVIVSPGWAGRGQGALRLLEIVVGHHTGTASSAPGDYPSLKVVQDGRAGLVGLLSQLGLGRSGTVYVMGNGLAYHAGASAYAGYVDLNDESIGIEAESSGDGRWTEGQLLIYPRLVGACLYYMRRGVDHYASHRTVAVPAGRKPDPAGISDSWMRQKAAAFLANPTALEDDMQPTDLVIDPATGQPAKDVNGRPYTYGQAWYYDNLNGWAIRSLAEKLNVKIDALASELSDDEANILAAVRTLGAPTVELKPEDVEQFANTVLSKVDPAVRDAVRAAFARAGEPEGN